MSYIWHADPTQFNIGWLKETLKLRLSYWFKQAWSSLVQNAPSATHYKIFKTSFGFEQYLTELHSNFALFYVNFAPETQKSPARCEGLLQKHPRTDRICKIMAFRDT